MIRDVMSKHVVTIAPEATVRDAVNTLLEHRFSGVPVVTDGGNCIGTISLHDVIDVLFDPALWDVPVTDRMNPEPPAVGVDESLSRAAHLLILYGTHWLPVIEGHAVVGILSSGDLLRYAKQHGEPLTDPLVEMMPSLGRIT